MQHKVRKLLLTAFIFSSVMLSMAQNIDFDLPGKTAPGKDTEVNYESWAVPRVASDTKTFSNGVTITITAGEGAKEVGSNWSKTDVETNGLRIIADEVLATNIEDGNLTKITDASTSLILTIEGLSAGAHTLKAYHNNSDKDQVQPDFEVLVDGTVVATKQKFTSYARSTAEAGTSFIRFNVTEGQPVVITYRTVLEEGKTYTNTRMMLNGLEFDVAEIVATDPIPENHNFHAGTDDGSITFSWTGAQSAVSHKLVIGTDSLQVANATTYDYEGTASEYTKTGLYPMNKYWWRVDEVTSDNQVHKGNVWVCQPRKLAFPEAEGYGRYAIGGRGGIVYHVTNLSGDKDTPGSLLYGLVNINEPRYIVFDVSGIIELDFNSYFVKPNAYIAGQTAPGKGICIKSSNINIGSDVIARHMRFKRGLGVYGENTGNAMGMSGANHAIVDHCTAAWGTDETVSGRGAQNISFQYSGIFEALGITGHKNYSDGTNHGYAATIDGRIGSWHHNLLLNCEGRNWSMGGGMDAQNIPIGGLDLFNNVCYNWHNRTTDGNCHMVNFVGNYYKMGTNTNKKVLFTQDFEDAINPAGTDQAYVHDNIRENKDHTLTTSGLNNATGNKPTSYQYVVNEPLFPSYAQIHSAKDAMKIVTSYAGATMPQRDEQHVRVVRETLGGTWTYKGSKSGIKGEIDTEEDITEHAAGKGWETYPEETRAADYDTDGDGMPDWYEPLVGSDPNIANQNDDPDHDGWTLLEDYLEFAAHPCLVVSPDNSATIDVKPFFAGFYGQNSSYDLLTPTYSVETESSLFTPSVEGSMVKATAGKNGGVGYLFVTVNDGQTTWTQRISVAVTGSTTGITVITQQPSPDTQRYNLAGQRVGNSYKGVIIQNGKTYLMK